MLEIKINDSQRLVKYDDLPVGAMVGFYLNNKLIDIGFKTHNHYVRLWYDGHIEERWMNCAVPQYDLVKTESWKQLSATLTINT